MPVNGANPPGELMIGFTGGRRRIIRHERLARFVGEDVRRDLLNVPADAADPMLVNASPRDAGTGPRADPVAHAHVGRQGRRRPG